MLARLRPESSAANVIAANITSSLEVSPPATEEEVAGLITRLLRDTTHADNATDRELALCYAGAQLIVIDTPLRQTSCVDELLADAVSAIGDNVRAQALVEDLILAVIT
jgi:hypothetical protein